MKFEGLGDLQKLLDGMKNKIKQELEGEVTLSSLLTDEFIEKYTCFQNLEEFISKCPYPFTTEDKHTKYFKDEQLDKFIKEYTYFTSWGKLIQDAEEEYAASRVKNFFQY